MVNDFSAQFPSSEYSIKLFDFFTQYEALMFEAIPQTLRYFAPSESIDRSQYRAIMHDMFVCFAEDFEEILSWQDENLRKTYVIAKAISITLDWFVLGKTEFVLPLCSQWNPLAGSKFIHQFTNNKDEKITFLLHKHRDICKTCTTYYELCLLIMKESSKGDKAELLTSLYWLEKKQTLAELYTKPIANKKTEPVVVEASNEKVNKEKHPKLIVLALCAGVILGILTSSIYLLTTKQISNSTNLPIPLSNTKLKEQNLYDQLDRLIDQYLESTNVTYLQGAEDLAQEIRSKHNDKYGVDLVSYYRISPRSVHQELLGYRRELAKALITPSGDNHQQRLLEAQKLEQKFLSFGNTVEAQKSKVIIVKLHNFMNNYDTSLLIISDSLKYCKEKDYIFLNVHFLLLQAKAHTSIRQEKEAEQALEQVVLTSRSMGLQDIEASASKSLAGMYILDNQNEKAFSLCQSSLMLDIKNHGVTVSLLHNAGFSAFGLKQYDLAENYLNRAIVLSKENNNQLLLGLSYVFLASTYSERHLFSQAEELFNKALTAANSINDKQSQKDLLGKIAAYQAKSKLIQSHYTVAIDLYKSAILMFQEIGLRNDLFYSQLNEGIGVAMERTGHKDAASYLAVSKHYLERARAKNERGTCLLSFVPVSCD